MGKVRAKPEWRNRVVGFTEKPANQFTANAFNFRRHPVPQREAFRGLVSELGFAGAVLENVRTGNLIDGHLRIEEALSVDEEMFIPCVQVDLSESEEKLLLASYDPLSAMAEADKETLDLLLRDVSTGDAAVQEMLSKLAESEGLYFGEERKQEDEEQVADLVDRAAELQKKWKVKRGDLFQIGRHRLLCGDSTSAADVGRLMGGKRAQMVFTDPPFGNDLGYGRGQLGERYVANDESTDVLDTMPTIIDAYLETNSHCLIWVQWRTFAHLQNLFSSYKLRTVVVWDKKQAGLSGGGFAEQHEWLCVFIKGRATQKEYCGNVWSEAREGAFEGRVPHPTMKPVPLLAKAINLCSAEGDVILDLFGGSGSLMAAAEETGRSAYLNELEPKYCAVTLERLSLLGLEVKKLDG